jgi:hypothetical protein
MLGTSTEGFASIADFLLQHFMDLMHFHAASMALPHFLDCCSIQHSKIGFVEPIKECCSIRIPTQ